MHHVSGWRRFAAILLLIPMLQTTPLSNGWGRSWAQQVTESEHERAKAAQEPAMAEEPNRRQSRRVSQPRGRVQLMKPTEQRAFRYLDQSLTRGKVDISTSPGNRVTQTGMAGWGARIRTWEWWNQNPLPYHLATPQRPAFGRADHNGSNEGAKAPIAPRQAAWIAFLRASPCTNMPSA